MTVGIRLPASKATAAIQARAMSRRLATERRAPKGRMISNTPGVQRYARKPVASSWRLVSRNWAFTASADSGEIGPPSMASVDTQMSRSGGRACSP